MSNYYLPLDQMDDWVIYKNSIRSPRTEEDIKKQLNELFIGLHIEGLKAMFNDDAKAISQIDKGIYPPLKFEGEIREVCPAKFVMTYKD